MNEAIQQLIKNIETIKRSINKIRSKQLNNALTKDDVRSFVFNYFKEFRSAYLSAGLIEENLNNVDSAMQELLRCTQKSSLKSVYLRCLKTISQALYNLELKSIAPIINEKRNITDDLRYQKILDTLIMIKPSAALSYEQALRDLQDTNRKSQRGTAVEFREALREVLDTLAPDEDVRAQQGFKLELDAKGPTMKQKTVFILKARQAAQNQIKPLTDAINIVEELIGKFIRSVYERSSVATHTHTSKEEVMKIRDYVSLALIDLLEIKL